MSEDAARGTRGYVQRKISILTPEGDDPLGGHVQHDGFNSCPVWLYNADGLFEDSAQGRCGIGQFTPEKQPDSSIIVHLGGCARGRSKCLWIMDGGNDIVRLYQPRSEVLDGTWTFPAVEPFGSVVLIVDRVALAAT